MSGNKLRPGVLAARKLALDDKVEHWKEVETKFATISSSLKSSPYYHSQAQHRRNELSQKLFDEYSKQHHGGIISLTKQELIEIVLRWKFCVGKHRPAVQNLVQQNSDEQVQACTRAGLMTAMQLFGFGTDSNDHDSSSSSSSDSKNIHKSIQNTLQEICSLRGMGPAGASAVLSLVRPDVFAYMYDEVIETYGSKRVYTMPVYLQMNEQCWQKAKQLTNTDAPSSIDDIEGKAWTAHRVATTLWMAARLAASGDESLSFLKPSSDANCIQKEEKVEEKRSSIVKEDSAEGKSTTRRSKRQKR